MSELPQIAIVFIDYDNLMPQQKAAGILHVVTKVLIQLPWDNHIPRGTCEVRVYGGWYEGDQITRMAQDLTVNLQQDFPAIIRIPHGNGTYLALKTTAELAVSLLQEPRHHLFNTYRRKGRPSNIRVEKPDDVGCVDAACVLPQIKKLLKNGSCPKTDCAVANCDLVYRHEQKIVDTMLSCDLIHAVDRVSGRIILVSGDDDFLPLFEQSYFEEARPCGAILDRAHSEHFFHRAALKYLKWRCNHANYRVQIHCQNLR